MSNNRKNTIAIIGGGNMGEAFIKGLVKTNQLMIVEANRERCAFLKKTYKVAIVELKEAIAKAQVVILAVKPQDMLTALMAINETKMTTKNNPLYISIAAGLTLKFFEKHLSDMPRVVRTMPNMPGLIGEGITGVAFGKHATSADQKNALAILASIGQIVVVKEAQLDAITAVSGSGPAYLFLFVEEWIKGAKSLGFTQDQAKKLVYQTVIGSAHLLAKSPFEAGELREKVTSKGGTTAAALDVFGKAKFGSVFNKALSAAQKRAKELAK